MKPFHVKFNGEEALISIMIQVGDVWFKKTLKASSPDELWEGMEGMLKLDSLPDDKKAEASEYISKASEREAIETALPAWLAKGNEIKKISCVSDRVAKVALTDEDKDSILKDLGLFMEPEYA